MRKNLIKSTVAIAMLALPMSARADNPSLASFTVLSTVFDGLVGPSSFQVQFLYGLQGLSSSLFYQAGSGGVWTKILNTVGTFPTPTSSPAPGALFGAFNTNLSAGDTEIRFALCNGNQAGGTTNLATSCPGAGPGPFATGAAATNVRSLTTSDWNTLRLVGAGSPFGAASTLNTVFGFEDQDLAISDRDYNDLVFSTSLATRSVVPEPSTVALMAVGMLGLVGAARRRKA